MTSITSCITHPLPFIPQAWGALLQFPAYLSKTLPPTQDPAVPQTSLHALIWQALADYNTFKFLEHKPLQSKFTGCHKTKRPWRMVASTRWIPLPQMLLFDQLDQLASRGN
mmetsp:Transcript_48369/g.86149  ORF Transcript_48369/g.86149 Transcript_48369/m.86149 type:complete len:111 (-) Transcript_48369:125-457(-)